MELPEQLRRPVHREVGLLLHIGYFWVIVAYTTVSVGLDYGPLAGLGALAFALVAGLQPIRVVTVYQDIVRIRWWYIRWRDLPLDAVRSSRIIRYSWRQSLLHAFAGPLQFWTNVAGGRRFLFGERNALEILLDHGTVTVGCRRPDRLAHAMGVQ